MFSPAIRKLHLLHRRDKEDASASPPPATAAPFHSPSPRGFSVPDLVGSPSPTSRSPAPRPHGPPPPSYPDHGEMNFLDPYMTLQNKLWRQNTVSGKDIDYEVKVARIDADIRILKLQFQYLDTCASAHH